MKVAYYSGVTHLSIITDNELLYALTVIKYCKNY